MIYAITLFSDLTDKKRMDGAVYKQRDDRSVGYYFDKDKAINAVLNNDQFMKDDFYTLALIEPIDEGIYSFVDNDEQTWLSWDEEHTCWQIINVPEDMQNTCGFALG